MRRHSRIGASSAAASATPRLRRLQRTAGGRNGPPGRQSPTGGIPAAPGPARPQEAAIGTQLAPRTRRPRPATRARKRSPSGSGSHQTRELVGLGMVALAIFLGVTLFLGFGIGPVGGWLEDGLRLLIGRAVALAPLALIAVGIALILDHPLAAARPLRLGAAIGAAAILIALAGGVFGLGGIERDAWFSRDVVSERGGYLGELGYWATSSTVGDVGTGILVAGGLIAAVILISGASLGHMVRRGGQGAAVASRAVGQGVATATVTAIRGSQSLRERLDAVGAARRPWRAAAPRVPRRRSWTAPTPSRTSSATRRRAAALARPRPGRRRAAGRRARGLARGGRRRGRPRPRPEEDEAEIAAGLHAAAALARARRLRTACRGRPSCAARAARRPSRPSWWRAPAASSRRRSATSASTATVADTVSGPRVTRYELQLAPGTKVGRITALRDDLAYALAAREELRIIAPIPGKQAVGVEVPNPEAALVTLGDITREFPSHAGPLMAWLGLDLGGKPVYIDLSRMPHLLIAGSTGTGKSVCLNALLASILLRTTPDELRMILIDPKKVELNHYESIPHLLTPVVTNMKDAAAVLSNIVREMESRYELMGLARARNLRDWNEARAGGRRPADAHDPGRHRRARRPDDGLAGRGGGRDHPARPEEPRRRHPPGAGDPAPVGRRHHRDDQGERPVADRLRRLVAGQLARGPRRRRRRDPARARRHAVPPGRDVAAAAPPGRVRQRGGDPRRSPTTGGRRGVPSCARS